MTPQEAWTGIKPWITHLRVFGSKAYAHVLDQTRIKLDDKSKPFISIGYDSNSKGYKLYNPITQKTMISRDVEVDEEGEYLTCTRPDILYATGIVSCYKENPTATHFKASKRILRYPKGTLDYGQLYSATNDYRLVGYSDSDSSGDNDDQKSISGYMFYMGDTAFTWMSKK
ncbi:hypothetical protein SASPL_145550 [Salvia splendens]|uniref:Retroviral polymerase SH3-like domain-containing protein n=1 Tax=Salvia splendens TaxID=180675 RepID=A0A8X8WJ36_SALSN|nr:hypothetical protein SASPL_145550 [Salvia splendens]